MTRLQSINISASKQAGARSDGVSLGFGQRGLTMVELLVAMVISLLIVLAAVGALTVTRRGFSTVDASSQLRDNVRFTTDLIQRLGIQSGYKDTPYAATPAPGNVAGIATNPDPNVTGFNNALIDGTDPLNVATTRTTAVEGYGSDILILRYQTLETFPGSGVSDGSMIDCAGASPSAIPGGRYDRMVSIIHVAVSRGEPSLMCSFSTTGAAPFTTQPIVEGVENFQVLYGVEGVTAGVAPPASGASGLVADESAPDRYLRADQLTVAGDALGTNANWRRVRSIRIGLVLRGPPNSSQDRATQTFYPFGEAKSSSSGLKGSAMAATLDPGTAFTPAVDGRLRQTATFTVHLRNDQGL
ncbi:MAG: prepilin-type cleavage/methylation domain-containing protein [Polaromonas sp. 39-63-203]|jgi:type IV pilus assembly protein PilW|uniref:PilW family protein n=1 Tax=Polaromonas sp. TaxID=1869339 RepID=UPI000BDBF40B|nr:PilW family protein [Polaromonas sp.]OYZ84009.1 MAG: prepilin-type cleavage/methylation domain-containing protein [Polaromonas sp. 24-62-144]OZA98702.1 MAG: prepilin-type cleavage/methylation domain-containing protein [Polaromonas sp. 39-63-203]HQS30704.1 PilW family protein [Polaromonas sp.]